MIYGISIAKLIVLLITFIFCFGILFQIFLSIGKSIFDKKFLLKIFQIIFKNLLIYFILFFLFYYYGKGNYIFLVTLLYIFIVVFRIVYVVTLDFKSILLKNIGSDLILISIFILLYKFLFFDIINGAFSLGIFTFCVFFVFLFISYLLIFKVNLTRFEKYFLYVYYLFFSSYLICSQFIELSVQGLNSYFSGTLLFLIGMVLSLLLINFFIFYETLPINRDYESDTDVNERVNSNIDIMIGKYIDKSSSIKKYILFGVIVVSLLVLNNYFNILSDIFLINLILILYTNIAKYYYNLVTG